VHITIDGGTHWHDVAPKQLRPWAKVSIIDASHFDKGSAYIAVNTFRLDDLRPHLYRTHDSGLNWTEIVHGIPDGAAVNVIREDPGRKGLLFAGSERAVYVSLDDGDIWTSLRLKMPATSVRDLLVKGDDLVAATHGRGFWILDDITSVRQLRPEVSAQPAVLFRPQTATRVRWDMNTDTPLPPDIPAGKNPPDGAIIDYFLGPNSTGEAKLEILDANARVIRSYSSSDPVPQVDPMLPIPTYWVRPPQHLANTPGMHRFLWDMHYPPIPGQRPEYPMQAVFRNTAPATSAPWVMPGKYTVRLTAAGASHSQPLTVRMDPRVKTPPRDLAAQFTLSKQIYDDLIPASAAAEQIRSLRAQIAKRPNELDALTGFDKQLKELLGESGRFASREPGGTPDTLGSVLGTLTGLLNSLQEADAAPTSQAAMAAIEKRGTLKKLMANWNTLKSRELPRVNEQLRMASKPELALLDVKAIRTESATVADADEQDEQ
jgi:hypothetical protein